MAILTKIYPILLLPLLAGCEEAFTPDMPDKPMLCVNSLITAGEQVEVQVSKSRLYTDSPAKSAVSDADVRIYVNGELQLDSYIPKENDNIKIVAVSPSAGRAESDVSVPKAVAKPKIEWTASDVSCWTSDVNPYIVGSFKLDVKLTIDDPVGEDYYRFSYFTTPEEEIESDGHPVYPFSIGNFQYTMEPIFGEHIGIFESIMGGDAEGFSFFTDRQFAGKSYTLHLLFDNCRFQCLKGEELEYMAHFVINSVSPSYYDWAKYIWQRENGTLTELSDYGFGDPIWGYSNVSSGAGVVAAQSQSICTVDFTEFIQQVINEKI